MDTLLLPIRAQGDEGRIGRLPTSPPETLGGPRGPPGVLYQGRRGDSVGDGPLRKLPAAHPPDTAPYSQGPVRKRCSDGPGSRWIKCWLCDRLTISRARADQDQSLQQDGLCMPLLSPTTIRQAISHPEPEVRLLALEYFAHSFCGDVGVMQQVIEAVHALGPAQGWQLLARASSLPQSPETLQWVQDELTRPCPKADVEGENHQFALGRILIESPPPLLLEQDEASLVALPGLSPLLRQAISERLRLYRSSWDACWAELEELGRRVVAAGEYSDEDRRSFDHLAAALAWHGEGRESLVLDLLHRRFPPDMQALYEALEPQFLELAGRMRLAEAAPTLVAHLDEVNEGVLSNPAAFTLARIGGDAVAEAMTQAWPDANLEYRARIASAIGFNRSRRAAEQTVAWLDEETEPEVIDELAHAALAQIIPDAIERIVPQVRGQAYRLGVEGRDLRHRLVAAATLADVHFPEYEAWYQEAINGPWSWNEPRVPSRLSERIWGRLQPVALRRTARTSK